MTRWLGSGIRRDVCVLLAGTDGLRAQELKARLQDHYGERIEPRRFYGALETLVEKNHVAERREGIHDVYALTDPGERRLREHVAWVREEVPDA